MAVIKTETFHEAWKCDGCGTDGLSAYDCKQCPSCGAPLDDEQVYRTQKLIENYAFKGHDVHCAHCQTRNEKRFSCRNCGASLSDGDDERVEQFIYKSSFDGQPESRSAPREQVLGSHQYNAQLPSVSAIYSAKNRKWFLLGGSFFFLLALAALFYFAQLSRVIPVALIADRAHWEFRLSLEDYQPRQSTMTIEDGRFESLPSDAYDVGETRVFVRSEPIYQSQTVSQTCTGTSSQSNGDGSWTQTTYTYDCSYTEQVQVGSNDIWGTRYDYIVDRWEAILPLVKEGWGQETDFPDFTTSEVCMSSSPSYGCVRAPNEPQLTFTLHFFYYHEEERQDVARSMDRAVWEGFYLGGVYPAVLNGFGQIRAIQGIGSEYDELLAD